MNFKRNKIIKQHFFHIYAAIVIIFTSWTIFYSLPKPSYFKLILLIWIWRRYDLKKDNKVLIFFLFSIIFFRAFLPFQYYNYFNLFFQISNVFLLSSLFIIPKDDLEIIFIYLIKILVPILIIGLIQHIFIISGIHILPKITDIYVNKDKGIYSIYLLNVYNLGESRFYSIFNEAGYLGTFIAFILAIKNYNLKNKKYLILFISAIFTLSLNFFLLTIFYFVLIIFLSKKRIKYISLLLGILIIIIISNKLFPNIFNEIFLRLNYIPGVGLSDKRANFNYLLKYWNSFYSLNLQSFLWGIGKIKSRTFFNIGHVGWVNLVSQLGAVFSLLLISLILIPGIKNKKVFIFGLIFLLSIDSRPQIFRLLWIYLLALGLSKERN